MSIIEKLSAMDQKQLKRISYLMKSLKPQEGVDRVAPIAEGGKAKAGKAKAGKAKAGKARGT